MPRSLTLSPAVSFSEWSRTARRPSVFSAPEVTIRATFLGVRGLRAARARRLEGQGRSPRPATAQMIATYSPMPTPARAAAPQPVRHNGFTLEVRASRREAGAWGYAVLQDGNLLAAEPGGYHTPRAAAQAARELVDDALASWARVTG